MKTISKIAATTVAIICMLAFSSVPALAAGSGNINLAFNSSHSGPQIKTITPSATTVTCNPDGTQTLAFHVIGFSSGGYQQLGRLDAQIMKGTATAGPIVSVASGTPQGAKDADYSISVVFQYYWLNGVDYKVRFTLYDLVSDFDTQDSVALTYAPAVGVTIEGSTVNFATLTYGQTSSVGTAALHNSANTPITIRADAPNWVSDVAFASPVPINSLSGSSDGITYYQMSPIITLATSGVGTLGPGSGSPPASITTSWRVSVPAASDTFVLVGNYTTAIQITATAT
jgi:hypothetical protein